jgi:hypothetical protein
MRVSPRDLRGIRAEGLLTRFAILGPIAFVSVELPVGGSSGTSLEKPTDNPAWAIVLAGSISLHGPDEQLFPRGTAFHVPAGPPQHWFTAPGRAVIAGFAPLNRDVDTSDAGIRELGFEPLSRMPAPHPPPAVVEAASGGRVFRGKGSIEVENAQMGEWVFARTTYGPLSGYTSGWCDLAHWGMVLSGDLALRYESEVELLSAGDVFYCPPGPPGHQFQVADAATTIDYTPAADLFGRGRKAEWRSAAARRLQRGEAAVVRAGQRGTRSKRAEEPTGETRGRAEETVAPQESGGGRDRDIASLLHLPSGLLGATAGRSMAGNAPLRSAVRGPVQWVRRGLLRPAGDRIG